MSCRGKGLISALVLGGWLMVSLPSAGAMNCEEDSLSDVSGEGAILTTISGHIYRVDDADQVDSGLWLAAEDVLVCDKTVVYQGKRLTIHTIINKEENGEEVMVERLR